MKSNFKRLKSKEQNAAGFCSVVVVVPLLPETLCNQMLKKTGESQSFKQKSRIV